MLITSQVSLYTQRVVEAFTDVTVMHLVQK